MAVIIGCHLFCYNEATCCAVSSKRDRNLRRRGSWSLSDIHTSLSEDSHAIRHNATAQELTLGVVVYGRITNGMTPIVS